MKTEGVEREERTSVIKVSMALRGP